MRECCRVPGLPLRMTIDHRPPVGCVVLPALRSSPDEVTGAQQFSLSPDVFGRRRRSAQSSTAAANATAARMIHGLPRNEPAVPKAPAAISSGSPQHSTCSSTKPPTASPVRLLRPLEVVDMVLPFNAPPQGPERAISCHARKASIDLPPWWKVNTDEGIHQRLFPGGNEGDVPEEDCRNGGSGVDCRALSPLTNRAGIILVLACALSAILSTASSSAGMTTTLHTGPQKQACHRPGHSSKGTHTNAKPRHP